MRASRTGEAGDEFLLFGHRDADESGDPGIAFRRIDRALRRVLSACDDSLGKRTAARFTAGAALRLGQHVVDLFDARVFVDIELFVGDAQDDGQNQSQGNHENTGRNDTGDRNHGNRPVGLGIMPVETFIE